MDNYEALLESKINRAYKNYYEACQGNLRITINMEFNKCEDLSDQLLKRFAAAERLNKCRGQLASYIDALETYRKLKKKENNNERYIQIQWT